MCCIGLDAFIGGGKPLSPGVSLGWLIVDFLDFLIILISSIYGVWSLPVGGVALRIIGLVFVLLGFSIMLAGMLEFRSVRMVLGLEQSKLITTGIYKWSRNPQFLGWFLMNIGVALIGLSGYALLMALLIIASCHYYIVRLEEPYLERVFGDRYLEYELITPRYMGICRRGD